MSGAFSYVGVLYLNSCVVTLGGGWLGVFAGQVSGGQTSASLMHPQGLVGCGLWAARTASPRAPSCCASSSWLPPPWELDDWSVAQVSPGGFVTLTGNSLKVQAEHTHAE